MLINLNIEVTKIPKDRLFKSEKTDRIYLNCTVAKRKEKDKFDNTHTVYLNQTEEERKNKAEKIYIGEGKEVEFTPQQAQSAPIADDDLPF